MPSLRFFRGPDLLIEYRLRAGRTTVGRADTCDVSLPGETISRTHCIIEGRNDRWELIDRSRHGVLVDGVRVAERAVLRDGARLTVSPYEVEVSLVNTEPAPTAPQGADQGHEILLSTDELGVQVERAVLVVVSGDRPGRRVVLRHARMGIGAAPSAVDVESTGVLVDHCFLRVARGRVMIEPGRGTTFIDGQRIRDITPLHAEEEFRIGEVVLRVERGVEEEAPQANRFGDMVAESRSMRQLFGTLRRVAGHHYTVLVVGESGTGKELVSRGIHAASPRAGRPGVAMEWGAISEGLFESELFGHVKGSFTGADRQKDGAFQEADGGTLFLDEIGELPENAQTKLLRCLETGEVRRVGASEVHHPDVRVVAATNRDLAHDVARGVFRQDLYFRLSVLTVTIPPLRDRLVDLEVLCKTLCRQLDAEAHVTRDAMEVLRQHEWPGNIRELRNVLTRAYVLKGPRIDVDSLTFHQMSGPERPTQQGANRASLEDAERSYLVGVLRRHGENRSSAARELGIARSTLHYKMRKHGLMDR
jgi:DNA-binding NtrC family response regulator/pSer/pThr/pTyr-binding forkhead associated (FHA) protein